MAQEESENLIIQEEPSMDHWNDYSQRKGYAKGLVDIALLTANANQLRYALELDQKYIKILNIVLLSLSIGLQVVAGILLILDHRLCIQSHRDLKKCQMYTTSISCIMFVIIVLNVIIVSFGGPEMSPDQ